ncbi:MAG TPA: DUF5996 family protein [Terriglobales bacterium]|nr:DUF5996 family protein [Terriglobales bacterium]
MPPDAWPPLPLAPWKDTYATLHRWLQIAGKVRLALGPHLNQFWEATYYLTASGLTTSVMPLPGDAGVLELEFDFLSETLLASTSHGGEAALPLRPMPVADFQRDFDALLHGLDVHVKTWPMPVEIPHPVRFDQDREHASYDPEAVRRWWRVLVASDRVFQAFRAEYQGKCSPVHLFWGSLDLAVTRFSGRPAPPRPGADRITQEAYSQEVASVGFWPGNDDFPEPAYYAYAAPEPTGFRQASLAPATAFYWETGGEFLLRYDEMRRAGSPDEALLAFCHSSYEAAARLGNWDRNRLELKAA